jgi:arylsulfatase A-like enzyme
MSRAETDCVRRPFGPILLLALAIAVCGACGAGDSNEPPRADALPNFVLLIGDDHGWPYFGFMGDDVVKTPHLDSLAEEGVLFPFGFATASTCRPSLRSLLTGLHPVQWREKRLALRAAGRTAAGRERIRDFATIPRLLKQRGYASFQGGKYWEPNYLAGGFTHGMKSAATTDSKEDHAFMQSRAGGDSLELGRTTMQPLWDFLESHREQPFFVWLAPKLPHTPHDPPEDLLGLYAEADLSEAARLYYANISRFDRLVGELVGRLDELGLRENTLIVYLSDNGWEQGRHQTNRVKQLGGPKGKSSMYELGFRTPIIVNWPAGIDGGRRHEALVSFVDVFTTLLDFAGASVPADRTGFSLRSVLLGESGPSRRTVIGSMSSLRPPDAVEAAYANPTVELVRPERASFLRDANWHYIWYEWHKRYGDRSPDALYRIEADPFETRDVAADHPDLVSRYRDEIRHWRMEVGERTRVGVDIDIDIETGHSIRSGRNERADATAD